MNHVRSSDVCVFGRASLLNVASHSYSHCGVLQRMSSVKNKESQQKATNISRLLAINVHSVVAISVKLGI